MKLMDMSCPNCTAKLNIKDENAEYVVCEYCDSRIVLEHTDRKIHYETPDRKRQDLPDTESDAKAEYVEKVSPDQMYVETGKEKNKKMILAIICAVSFGMFSLTQSAFWGCVFVISTIAAVIYLPKRTLEDMQRMDRYAVKRVRISKKNRWVAFLLCLFFGVVGVHNFYVGKVGKGILYIFTGGLFSIGYFVDLIMILTGHFKDSQGGLLV